MIFLEIPFLHIAIHKPQYVSFFLSEYIVRGGGGGRKELAVKRFDIQGNKQLLAI